MGEEEEEVEEEGINASIRSSAWGSSFGEKLDGQSFNVSQRS